ncbi:hypothetical protein EJB05_35728 [Eragrostis curvula]|uniref:Myb-like domain-containing protein n=1 Tax=Eragrostis curvula TaxID=38414 RepID=A0A5J9U782_9POAL|nr:hypothetical protein EJB05_35728 [Eragrostis curvula]
MRAGRSAAVFWIDPWNQESGTPVAPGTPWKGRLRSNHATPQSVPTQRLPSSSKNREEAEGVETSKKRGSQKNLGRGRRAGAARLPQRRSPRLTGSDPEHPIVIDEVSEESKGRDDQVAIQPLRRSPRFHTEDKDSGKQVSLSDPRQTGHQSLKRNKRNAGAKPLTRMKSQKEAREPCQGQLSHCEVLTGKRKRGTEGKSSSKRQSCQDPKSLAPDCQEIAPSNEPRKSVHSKIEKDPSVIRQPKIGDEILTNADKINKAASGEGREHCCDSDDWTEEQDMALCKAYFTARPSPHFWKRVSKMVPGRSAEECFNKIHADLSTPTPIGTRPRTSKSFSPLGKFTLSDAKLPNLLEPTVVRKRTAKQKNLAAQKTVRHLLQKHCRIDQAQEADHFSIFETSPSAIQLNISLEDSPGTPDSYMSSGSLNKCSGSSSVRKKPFSRLGTKQAEPSPAVLKPVKNAVLHERYINQLSRREGTKKRSHKRTPGSKSAGSDKTFYEKQAGGLKAAKSALISEATDFIGRFKKLQADSHAHIVENSEDDESDCNECDASDDDHADKE